MLMIFLVVLSCGFSLTSIALKVKHFSNVIYIQSIPHTWLFPMVVSIDIRLSIHPVLDSFMEGLN